jgi:nuclear GTP-binding protein
MSKKRKRDGANEATPSVAAQDDADKTDGEFDGLSGDDDEEYDDDESVEADLAGGVSLETPEVDDDDESEDDEAVEADLAAISAALSKAKKRQRKA